MANTIEDKDKAALIERLSALTTFDPTTRTFKWRWSRGRRRLPQFGNWESAGPGRPRRLVAVVSVNGNNKRYLVDNLVALWEEEMALRTTAGPTDGAD